MATQPSKESDSNQPLFDPLGCSLVIPEGITHDAFLSAQHRDFVKAHFATCEACQEMFERIAEQL